MSQENIAVVKAVIDAWNAGDMTAFRELHHPDVIMRAPEGWPEPGPFIGRDAAMQQFEQMRETWDADALELLSDYFAVGDRVALRFIWRGVGQGPDATIQLTSIYTIRGDKVFAQEYFWDHSAALKALGVAERE